MYMGIYGVLNVGKLECLPTLFPSKPCITIVKQSNIPRNDRFSEKTRLCVWLRGIGDLPVALLSSSILMSTR